jgi:hypothetical protein
MKPQNTTEEYSRLPMNISKNGFEYVLISRGGKSLIYEQTYDQKIISYEVFSIKIAKAGEVFGKFYPDREVFPGNEDFGYWAWAYISLDKALDKFNELEKS